MKSTFTISRAQRFLERNCNQNTHTQTYRYIYIYTFYCTVATRTIDLIQWGVLLKAIRFTFQMPCKSRRNLPVRKKIHLAYAHIMAGCINWVWANTMKPRREFASRGPTKNITQKNLCLHQVFIMSNCKECLTKGKVRSIHSQYLAHIHTRLRQTQTA